VIRIVAKKDNAGMAANVGGSVISTIKTFDVEIPELELYLNSCGKDGYSHVQVVGVEVLYGPLMDPGASDAKAQVTQPE
jgi:hypothetical protein